VHETTVRGVAFSEASPKAAGRWLLALALEAAEVADRAAEPAPEREADVLGTLPQPAGADPMRVAEQLADHESTARLQDTGELP
jgi:hypothetical protein